MMLLGEVKIRPPFSNSSRGIAENIIEIDLVLLLFAEAHGHHHRVGRKFDTSMGGQLKR